LRNTLAFYEKNHQWQNSFIFPIPGRAPAPGGNFILKPFSCPLYQDKISWGIYPGKPLCEALKYEVYSSKGQILQLIFLES
jgi:hypothetical protein